MPFYLQTATVPGDANWVFEVPGSIGPITGLMFVDATFVGASDGSIAAPFTTIQAALDAIGDATTEAEQFQGWKVVISGNFYDEDLVIPQRRSIVLDCAPGCILADGFGSPPPPPTTPRKITWAQNLAPLGAVESYGLQINNLIMFDGIELVSGGAAVNPTLELSLNTVSFISGVVVGTIPSIDGTGLTAGEGIVEGRDCLFRATGVNNFCVESGGNNLYFSYANSCEFDEDVEALGYGQMVNSTFAGDQTYTDQGALVQLDRPEGFFNCQFADPSSFTNTVAGECRIDGVTWRTTTNVTFSGLTTIASLDNPYVDQTDAGTWVAGGDDTMVNAIQRMSQLLAANFGPIPL